MGCFKAKTKFNLPSYIEKPNKIIGDKAVDELGKSFVAYDKPMVAGMNNSQNSAMDMLNKLMGDSSSGLPRVIDDVPGASGGPKGSTADYMNPYISQVMEPVLRQLGITNKQNQMDVDAKANMSGAFGDTGHALERAETTERGTQAVGDATSRAYYDAFQSAMGLKQNDIDRISSGRSQSAQIADRLFGMGGTQQQTEQAGLDAQMSEFLREQGFSTEQMAKIASIIGSLNQGQMTTKPSTASSVLGAASGIGSIIAAL